MVREKWRSVTGFEGRYSVSNLGRVRSEERRVTNSTSGGTRRVRERILRTHAATGGYLHVWLCTAGQKASVFKVATLVARAFLGARPEGLDVCHINGVNTDNRVENLRYGTRVQNMQDAARHGTMARGEKQGLSKLTERDVLSIRSDSRLLVEIAKDYGISFQHVSAIKRKASWKWLEKQ